MKKIVPTEAKKEKELRRAINELTKATLNAYKKGHKQYSRNMRGMFNSLIDNNIIEGLDNIGINKFKKIWPKLKKELKMGLIITSFYDSNKFTSHYKNNGRPISKLAVVGSTIVEKGLNPLADGAQAIKYRQYLLEAKYMVGKKRTLQEMREYLQYLNKEPKKDIDNFVREIQKVTKQMHKLSQDEAFSNVNNGKELVTNTDDNNLSIYADVLREESQRAFDQVQEALNENIDELKQRIKEKRAKSSHLESLKAEAQMQVKEAQEHTIDILQSFKQELSLMQEIIQNKQTTNDSKLEKVPFVQKEMKALIRVDKVLITFKELVDQLRMDYRDAGDVMTYGSGGPDRRTSISGIANPETGDLMEGFGMNNLKTVSKELMTYKDVFSKLKEPLPESNVKKDLEDLEKMTENLATKLYDEPKFFERQLAPHGEFRDDYGHILNIDEHPMVQQMMDEIQDGLKQLLLKADKTAENSQNFQAFNEQEIIMTKREKLNIKQLQRKLHLEEKSIDKLINKYNNPEDE